MLDSNNLVSSKNYAKYIPVGSVEYVTLWLKTNYPNCNIKPINIPDELFRFANRDIKRVFGKDKIKSTFPVFIKSDSKIKGFSKLLGVFDSELECDVELGDYIISQYVDIASEWRCFVENGVLIDMRCYSGNFWAYPDGDVIENMIMEYKTSPKSYSLDVLVDFDNNTSILEVHNFFSCGLYGFNDYLALLNMTRDGINWQIKQ